MKTKAKVYTSIWPKLEALALEKDILDGVDAALILTLCRRIERPQDLAFPTVVACLLKTVHAGGVRIRLHSESLTQLCQDFLTSLIGLSATPPANLFGTDAQLDPQLLEACEDIPKLANRLVEEFTQNRLTGIYASVLGSPPEYLPLIQSSDALYFQKHHSAEVAVSLKLKHLLLAPDQITPLEKTEAILATVLERLPLRLGFTPDSRSIAFDDGQQSALRLALRKRFTLISGGPGTGKTSLAANLLRAWTRAWFVRLAESPSPKSETPPPFPRIRLTAPTGRAAQRLAESIQRSLESIRYPSPESTEFHLDQHLANLSCETLHSLLRYNPSTGEYFYRAYRPLPADLVVIDEVSMVDIFVFSRLLNALEENTCLVLLGDKDQLPSIDSGSMLADLIPDKHASDHPLRDNIAMLEFSHRSEAGILDVTQRINAQDAIGALEKMGPALSLPVQQGHTLSFGGGCRLLLPHTSETSPIEFRSSWKFWLDAWVTHHYLGQDSYAALLATLSTFKSMEEEAFKPVLSKLFTLLDQARILTFTRKGWHGCTTINQTLRENLIRTWDPKAPLKSAEGFHG